MACAHPRPRRASLSGNLTSHGCTPFRQHAARPGSSSPHTALPLRPLLRPRACCLNCHTHPGSWNQWLVTDPNKSHTPVGTAAGTHSTAPFPTQSEISESKTKHAPASQPPYFVSTPVAPAVSPQLRPDCSGLGSAQTPDERSECAACVGLCEVRCVLACGHFRVHLSNCTNAPSLQGTWTRSGMRHALAAWQCQ